MKKVSIKIKEGETIASVSNKIYKAIRAPGKNTDIIDLCTQITIEVIPKPAELIKTCSICETQYLHSQGVRFKHNYGTMSMRREGSVCSEECWEVVYNHFGNSRIHKIKSKIKKKKKNET